MFPSPDHPLMSKIVTTYLLIPFWYITLCKADNSPNAPFGQRPLLCRYGHPYLVETSNTARMNLFFCCQAIKLSSTCFQIVGCICRFPSCKSLVVAILLVIRTFVAGNILVNLHVVDACIFARLNTFPRRASPSLLHRTRLLVLVARAHSDSHR